MVSAAIHQDKSGETLIEEEKQKMSAAGTEEKCSQVLGRKGRRGGKGRGKEWQRQQRCGEGALEEPRPREKVSLKERTPQRKEKVSLRERSPQRKEKEEEEPVLREKVSLKEGAHMKVVNRGYGNLTALRESHNRHRVLLPRRLGDKGKPRFLERR